MFKNLSIIKSILRYSSEKDQTVLQNLKDTFTTLKRDGAVSIVDYFIAARASAYGDMVTLGTLRNFITPALFVEEIVEILSSVFWPSIFTENELT